MFSEVCQRTNSYAGFDFAICISLYIFLDKAEFSWINKNPNAYIRRQGVEVLGAVDELDFVLW